MAQQVSQLHVRTDQKNTKKKKSLPSSATSCAASWRSPKTFGGQARKIQSFGPTGQVLWL
jgi:hypothetical protein